jgi:signal transduction histidine kinase
MLATIGGQAYRIRDMIGDVMLFARPPEPRPERLDLRAACEEVVARFIPDAAETESALVLEPGPEVPVHADPVQLRVVISALVRNALEAVGNQGRIIVSAAVASEAEHRWGVLRVVDNGKGLSEADREHLFDPFYSGRQAGRGLGFGLPKAWRIVEMHGGRIEVDSPEGGGVTFTVHWPGEAASVQAAEAPFRRDE